MTPRLSRAQVRLLPTNAEADEGSVDCSRRSVPFESLAGQLERQLATHSG
jgi:hypothetical protein